MIRELAPGWCDLLKNGERVCTMPFDAVVALADSVAPENRHRLDAFEVRRADGSIVAAADLSTSFVPIRAPIGLMEEMVAEWLRQMHCGEHYGEAGKEP